MLKGLKMTSSLHASILSVLKRVMALAIGVMLLNESLSAWQYVSVLLVLSSALLIQFRRGYPHSEMD